MIGIPIFAGFSSKLFFGIAAVEADHTIKLILVMLGLAISSLLNAYYFIRTMIRLYSSPNREIKEEEIRAHHRPGYNIPMIVLTVMNLILGLFSGGIMNLIQSGLSMF